MNASATQILSRCRADKFVGRDPELHRLLGLSRQSGKGSSMVLLCEPGAGASELLRQTYDRLFNENSGVAPVYFEIKRSDETARRAAHRFLRAFLAQLLAYRRRDSGLLRSALTMDEIERHALSADKEWVAELVSLSRNDEEDVLDSFFAAPERSLLAGAPNVVLVDGLAEAMHIEDGSDLLESVIHTATTASAPFVIAGPRRMLFGRTPLTALRVDRLHRDDASGVVASVAEEMSVGINDETRDLVTLQLDRDLSHIEALLASAAENGVALDSFASFEKVYTGEIFGGRISRSYETLLDPLLDRSSYQKVLHLLKESRGSVTSEEDWQRQLALSNAKFSSLIQTLHYAELINAQAGKITIESSKIAFADLVDASIALRTHDLPRGSAVASAVLANIARAPQIMAKMYRTRAAIGLRDIMAELNGQKVPKAVLDYSTYKTHLKGLRSEELLGRLSRQADRIELPRVHFAVYTADIYPQLTKLCERECSAVGIASDEVMLAAEIESKLEATREAAEFWCDRLEMVAAANGFESVRTWLIAPEGFDDEAMRLLKERNAIGSSRAQIDLLRQFLADAGFDKTADAIEQFELTVPMGEEGEVISARTVEDIGRRYHVPQRALNQIKTAVVEACINAAEHSLSPDRHIYQTFAIHEDRLTITIANRGVRLADKKLHVVSAQEGRRGWGLKLMQGLMDEVMVEDTDDGTKIIMTKFLDITRDDRTAASQRRIDVI